jgi:hypothetical protein
VIDRLPSVSKIFLLVCLGIFVFVASACTPLDVAASSAYLTACPSTSKDRNPYFSHPPSLYITNIFTSYRNGSATARQEALMQLGKNMDIWSDYKNLVSDNGQVVRVVVTYLDPVLVQYIILNNVLSLPREVANSVDITARIQSEMTKLEQYDMLLFAVVINSSITNVQAGDEQVPHIKIPVEQLILTHPSGRRTVPSYYDHILTEKINVAQGPIYGIVGYPVSVWVRENCTGFLGGWTSSLTIDIASLSLGEKTFNDQFWNIPFQPLMLQDDNHPTPAYDQSYEARLSKLEIPPLPDSRTKTALDETTSRYYWEDMGRYLWKVLIGESGH